MNGAVCDMLGFSVDGLIRAMGHGYYILVYGIGIFAMLLSVIAVHFKRRVTILLVTFLGQSVWIVYFLLQGDLTSAIACAISAVMLSVFAQKDRWKWAVSRGSIVLFLVLLCGFSLLSFRGWTDLFPLLAGVFAVIANSREEEQSIRRYTLLWCVFWLLNSACKLYPVALVNDLSCTVSTVVSLIRYRKKRDEGFTEK